ncbi:SGNH/GDSL hydrolase family protein [Streptomyces sp. NPDC049910]|uniref:SGNH/GDSL hydrolase family protein n=1 Tax=Streptomyces sp. NPDC049910 TaxID=3155278 RepID=UPI00342CDCA1
MKVFAPKPVVILTLTLALTLGAAPAHDEASGHAGRSEAHYAALGDSYASGVGAGSYIPSSSECLRSSRSYASLWAAAHGPKEFQFLACSGATATDVLQSQVPRMSRATTLVTLTVGGDDLDFSRTVQSCLLPASTDAACDQAIDQAEHILQNELPEKLQRLYQAIDSAAPESRVVLAGYPHVVEIGTPTCMVGTPARRAKFNAVTDQLDDLIRKTGNKQGFAFADARLPFAGHGVCARRGVPEWINAEVEPSFASFHPNVTGQRIGYLPTVSAYMRKNSY